MGSTDIGLLCEGDLITIGRGMYVVTNSLGGTGNNYTLQGADGVPRLAKFAGDDELQRALYREVVAANLLQFPGYEYGISSKGPCMLRPLIPGKDLETLLQREPFDPEQCLSIVRDVCTQLDYAHKNGVIHRDVKPANIIVTVNGKNATLIDFGLALIEGLQDPTPESVIVGTPYCLAPEIIKDGCYSPKSDTYALGVTVFRAMSGRWPIGEDVGEDFVEVLKCHKSRYPLTLNNVNPNVPRRVAKAIAVALEKDPGNRYQTAKEFSEAFEDSLRHSLIARAYQGVCRLGHRLN